ncbi:MAG TPA: ABC transporter permease [Phycisphaerae bacterium]|nr:ABC transporter permease [Phycisphaerae bacterium]
MTLPVSYNWRNLFVRKLSTALTFLVVAVVVGVLAILLSFAEGIRMSLRASGSPRNIMVLKTGATAESTSIVNPEEAGRLVQAPGIAKGADGAPLISPELCVQTSIPRRGPEGTPANVAVRGIDPIAWQVHQEVSLIQGERFNEGATEIIVGKAAAERYANLQIGESIELGRTSSHPYKVVGIFEADGGALESEIWASRGILSNAYSRNFVSSVLLRLAEGEKPEPALDYIRGPAVNLTAKTETEYYEDLTSKSAQIVALTSILIAIMATGAVFAVANTMYAAVDGRRRELAMLRTIGFTKSAILTSIVIESLMICLIACGFGLGGASFMSGSRQDFLSDTTWTVLAYELRMTPTIVISSILVAAVVGVIGAAAPAIRASRIHILDALRKA